MALPLVMLVTAHYTGKGGAYHGKGDGKGDDNCAATARAPPVAGAVAAGRQSVPA
jgi:hypothetical protein